MLMLRMMKICSDVKSNWLLLPIVGVIILMLIGCGNGVDNNTSGNSLAGGGVGGTGVCVGSVSSFGSIYANGIHFDTRDAEIFIEGDLLGKGDIAASSLLNIGQMVRIEGDIRDDGSGVAGRVYYDKTIEGPIASVEILDPYTSRVVVLGQQIIIDSQTQFVRTSLESLEARPGMVVEISGFFSDDGLLKASFVGKKHPSLKTYTVTGCVSALDTTSELFEMGALIIDYSGVMLPMPTFEDSDKVRVKGHLVRTKATVPGDDPSPGHTPLTGFIFKATEVMEWAPLDFRLEAERIKIQGVVRRLDNESEQAFMVNGIPVHVDEKTAFQGIENADGLDDGIELLVSGDLLEGVVQAEVVEIKSDSLRVEGLVSNIDTDETTFTIDGQLVRINPTTTIYKHSNSPCENPVSIVDGVEEDDDVVVYGWVRTDNSITAKWIKINPQNTNCVNICYWVYSPYYGGYVLYCPQQQASGSSACSP